MRLSQAQVVTPRKSRTDAAIVAASCKGGEGPRKTVLLSPCLSRTLAEAVRCTLSVGREVKTEIPVEFIDIEEKQEANSGEEVMN